jgi:hypothetical protein
MPSGSRLSVGAVSLQNSSISLGNNSNGISPAGNAKRDLCPLHKASRGRVGQIPRLDPHVAIWRTGKICPPDLLAFLWQIGLDAIGIKCLRVRPINLSSLWINFERSFLADREPLLDRHSIISRALHSVLRIRAFHSLLFVCLFNDRLEPLTQSHLHWPPPLRVTARSSSAR